MVFPLGVDSVMGGVPSGIEENRSESSSRLKSVKSSSRAEDEPVGESRSSSPSPRPRVRGEVWGVLSMLRIGFMEAFDEEGEDERLRESARSFEAIIHDIVDKAGDDIDSGGYKWGRRQQERAVTQKTSAFALWNQFPLKSRASRALIKASLTWLLEASHHASTDHNTERVVFFQIAHNIAQGTFPGQCRARCPPRLTR